jgi:hypothetical protein
MPKLKAPVAPFKLGDQVEVLIDNPEGAPLSKGQVVAVMGARLIPNFYDPGYRPPKHVPKWIVKVAGDWEITEDQCRKA